MLNQLPAVYENRGNMGGTVKLQKKVLSRQLLPQIQLSAVAADALIVFVVGIVERHFRHRVGQADGVPLPFSQSEAIEPLRCKFPFIAKTEHSNSPLFFRQS